MGVKYVDKDCEYCGKRMVQVSSRRKYCDSCKKKAKNESNKTYKKYRKKNMPKPVREIIDISQCRTCKYKLNLGGSEILCNYCEIMGHSRGCEPSPNCTKYEEGKGKSMKLRRRGLCVL